MKRFGYRTPKGARPLMVNDKETSLEEVRHHAEGIKVTSERDRDWVTAGMADVILALLDRVDGLEEVLGLKGE